MSTVAASAYMPEDLLAMPDRKGFELVDGNLVEKNVSSLSSWVGGEAYGRLREYNRIHDLGTVWPADNGFQCFPDAPGKVRKPDAAFIGRERYSIDELSDGFVSLAPDLVVEVISTNDLARDVEKKVEEYLGAGVRLIWVIDPETRTIRIHRGDGSAARLRQDGELSGEDVVPGFRCLVRDLFPPARAAAGRT
jgi:Uma2 family endonuclease